MGPARSNLIGTVWAVLLIAMGVVLFIKKPYAVEQTPQSPFLNISRYIIALLLAVGGAKRLYKLYFAKDADAPPSD